MNGRPIEGKVYTVKRGIEYAIDLGIRGFQDGARISLAYDDNSTCPLFVDLDTGEEMFVSLDRLKEVRTEHKPRQTNGFTVAITEEALKDDIPFIIDAYYTANLSLRETGALLGLDEKTIRNRMKKHGVPTRTVSQALRAKYSM